MISFCEYCTRILFIMGNVHKYFLYKRALIFDGDHHHETRLSKEEATDILKNSNAFLLRNLYNFDKTCNKSFWYVIKDSFDGMTELKSRTRNKIRHAAKFFDIRPLAIEEVYDNAYEVYTEAYHSYKSTNDHILNRNEFLKTIDTNNEYWGCIDKKTGRLVAYSENVIRKESCEFRTLKALPEYLSGGFYPFYGLFYKMNEYYLQERKMRYLSDGSRTITLQSNIQNFLIENFNYRRAYTNIAVYYKPAIGLLVRLLYPFRNMFPHGNLKSLLRQEEMAKESKQCH